MNTFAERLRTARKAAKLNQTQLGTKAGLSQTTISNIESGRNASSRELIAIAKALKVDAEWLARGVGKMTDRTNHDPIFERFQWVYDHVTEDGRAFLQNALNVAASMYIRTK